MTLAAISNLGKTAAMPNCWDWRAAKCEDTKKPLPNKKKSEGSGSTWVECCQHFVDGMLQWAVKAVKAPMLPSRWMELHIPDKHPHVMTEGVWKAAPGNLRIPFGCARLTTYVGEGTLSTTTRLWWCLIGNYAVLGNLAWNTADIMKPARTLFWKLSANTVKQMCSVVGTMEPWEFCFEKKIQGHSCSEPWQGTLLLH